MRTRIIAVFAALSLPASALADPDAQRPAPLNSLGFYPAAARAAHVEGEATIRCARNAHLALKDCSLVSESPAGQGFGAAALAMAARSPDNPDLNVTEPSLTAAAPITVQFRMTPPQVDPDLTAMAHVVKRPQVAQEPSPARVGFYYPKAIGRDPVSGSARVHCHVDAGGALAGCTVAEEAPKGRHFGDAAIQVAEREYRMTPLLVDGSPTDQGEADLTIKFQPGPAPLPEAADAIPTDIKKVVWLRRPSGRQIFDVYPQTAQRNGVAGAAVIRCGVDAQGHLDPCTIVAERPAGYGFGNAALKLATYAQVAAKDADGVPTAGRTIVVPAQFWTP